MNMYDEKNLELIDIELYSEEEKNGKLSYYLNLVYTYDASDGKHELQIPKVDINIFRDHFPTFTYLSTSNNCPYSISEKNDLKPLVIFGDHSFNLGTFPNGLSGECVCINRLIEPRVEELTVEEIEKKLGYKVKIVNKK